MKYITDKIRKLSKANKKPLKSLASDIGVSVSTFTRFMSGHYVMQYHQIVKIADALNMDIKTRIELLSAAHAGVLRHWRASSREIVAQEPAADCTDPETDSTKKPAV